MKSGPTDMQNLLYIYIINKHKICHANLKLWQKNLKYKEPILIGVTDRF